MQFMAGEWIAAQLAAEGVDTVFGIGDGTYLGLLAGLEKHGIRLISPRHESSAAHMAGAYARLTGRVGVCIASNGPGVANVLPGVAVEQGEGNRVLLITSCRRRGISGADRPGAYQAFDQTGVIGAMAKWSARVPDAPRLAEMLRMALRQVHEGRPGVVHLDVPEDLLNGAGQGPETVRPRRQPVSPRTPSAEEIRAAVDLLHTAERPLIHAGSGVIHSRCFDGLQAVAQKLLAPVTTSWGARAALPDEDPHSLPLWALEPVMEARRTADVVLVLGSRLGETDWWGRPPHWGGAGAQKVVQVDVDAESLGLNRPVDLAIQADAGTFLEGLLRELERTPLPEATQEARRRFTSSLAEKRSIARKELDESLSNRSTPLATPHIPVSCQEVFDDDTVYVIDGGNTAVWCSFFTSVKKPDTVASTFKFGMLGAGVGQALGAQAAHPDRRVVCILGDGAMGFHLQEIETAVREELPVTFVVVCDRQWGMVKLTQHVGLPGLREAMGSEGEEPINADLGEIAFDRLAQSMGAHGERVASPDELKAALIRCRDAGGPAVLHVDVDPDVHLFAPGLQEFKAMHLEPEA